jgi:hypothetical protein
MYIKLSVEKLDNLTLESLTISKGSYCLELSGKCNDEFVTYFAGTSYNLSVDNSANSDAREKASEVVWPVLEELLISTKQSENQIRFIFENGKELLIWQEENAIDNLMIVTKKDSEEWFTIQ